MQRLSKVSCGALGQLSRVYGAQTSSAISASHLQQSVRGNASAGKRLTPLLDRVLIERFVPQTVSKGGIVLPESSQSKVNTGTVVATGPGRVNEKGELVQVSVKVGEQVLLPEYGGLKVEIDKKEFFIFRDAEIVGKWE